MKSFQQFINETIYDQQVKSFMNKKPEVAKSIIDRVRTAHNFHVITGEHDKEASAELHKRRTQGLHPRDAEEEVRDYPEGMLNKNKIVHSVSHNDMWK
jgi:hypothetical protein